MNTFHKKTAIAILISVTFLVVSGCQGFNEAGSPAKNTGIQSEIQDNYWPTDEWRTSTPEEQGMDSGKLADMLKKIETSNDIRSVLVIRHGHLVLEAYKPPYDKSTEISIKSSCKSVISALTGIAIREGYIKGIDQTVAEIFPEQFEDVDDQRKKDITLKHLLTMESGLLSTEADGDMTPWTKSRDWVKYVIDLPLKSTPGDFFEYSTGLSHIMSAIITKTSGVSTYEFADKYLFGPMGIKITNWVQDPNGIYIGGADLDMKPLDMAKFGYLYLHNGVWNGQQLIPKEWVEESTINQQKKRIDTHAYYAPKYGYFWWVTENDYQAQGWGGQSIIVNPKLDMVVVFTANNYDRTVQFLESYIYDAVKSDTSLKPNPSSFQRMKAGIEQLVKPKSYSVPSPEIIEKINGKTFKCEKNDLGLESFALSFQETECTFSYKLTDLNGQQQSAEFAVGLNDVYKFNPKEFHTTYFGCEVPFFPYNEPGGEDKYPAVFEGHWGDKNCFILNWLAPMVEPVRYNATFFFEGNTVDINLRKPPLEVYYKIKGTMITE